MARPAFIEIGGQRYLWRDLLSKRREQCAAVAKREQPALFDLKDDRRPIADRTADGRYLEPSLLTLLDEEG